jgi:hypothetical protein
MKAFLPIVFGLIVFSCNSKFDSAASSHASTTELLIDSLGSIDSAVIDQELLQDSQLLKSKTDSFLLHPFDLYQFKLKKYGSNSSGAYFKNYHFKPPIKGVGYSFFLFNPKEVNYIRDGLEMRHEKVGYIGRNKERLSFLEDGLIIKTFQPNDKYQHKYRNPNELLIEVEAKHNDFDLPELAFIGLSTKQVREKLGKETFMKNDCLVYTKDNFALILKISTNGIQWLRYIVLSKSLQIDSDLWELYQID